MLFVLQLRRYLNLINLLQLMARPALSATITALVVFLLRDQNLLLTLATGLAVYVGTLFAFGAVKRAEFNFIHGTLKH